MKKLLCLLILISGISNAQIVNIPDANFKAKLIEIGIDTNDDGNIQVSEALIPSNLDVGNSNIADLTGINSFVNLGMLTCSNNVLTSLDVTSLSNLTMLFCSQNQIANLNLSGLSLSLVDCANNQLTALNLTNTSISFELNCSNNLLTSLNVSGLNFGNLLCSNNALTTLDVSTCFNLNILYCSGNPLTSLYLKNGRNESVSFSNFSLEFICADPVQLESLQMSVTAQTVVSSYCTFTPGGNYNTINGNVTFDANNNGCEASDIDQSNIRVNINDGTNAGASFTFNNGNYIFYTQSGNFTVLPYLEYPAYFTVTPASPVISFANNNNNTATQNFCITVNGVHPDLEVVIAPTTPARPGFDAVYNIVYKNKGNQTLSGNVGFTYDDTILDFVSASLTPATQNTGSLSWNYAGLLPFESRNFYVTLNVNAPTDTPPVNIGDQLDFTVFVNPIAGDEIPADNTFFYKQTVVGSFDPNDITCLQGDVISPDEIGNYLHYAIRFENTGTAEAENIIVRMVVNPADFDVNTLQLLNASHNVDARITGNIVEFIFHNILLESGGHGNVLLKVKSKGNLQQGDMVNKQANIYFDYNYPVLTNDAETVFQSLSNPGFEIDNSISIYPNPSNGRFDIKAEFNIRSIQLFDVQGRLLQTNLVNDTNTIVDISSHSNGIYFVKVITERGMKVEKIVKQ